MNGFDDFDTQIQSDEITPDEPERTSCYQCGGPLCEGVLSDFCSKACAEEFYGKDEYNVADEGYGYDVDDGRWDDDPSPYGGTYSEE